MDKKLTLSKHIDSLRGNAQYKLFTLRRIKKILSVKESQNIG